MKIHKPYFLRAIGVWSLQKCPRCLLANSGGVCWSDIIHPQAGQGLITCRCCALCLWYDWHRHVFKVRES